MVLLPRHCCDSWKKHSQNPLLPILRKGNSKDLFKILWHESSQHRRVSTGSSEYTWGNKSQIWPWTKSPALISFIGLSLSFICIRKFWLNKYFHIWKTAFYNILFPFVWVWWLCVLYVASIYEEARGRLQVSSAYKKRDWLWNFNKYANVLCSYVFPFLLCPILWIIFFRANYTLHAYFHVVYILLQFLALPQNLPHLKYWLPFSRSI